MMNNTTMNEKEEEGKSLFYDPFTGLFEYLTMDEAQNHVNRNPEIYTGQFVSSIVTLENNDMQPCVTMQIKENYELPAFLYTKTVIPDPFEPDYFDSKKVIFSGNCTIVIWKDGTKTIARCNKWDEFSPEAGVAICFMKHVLGEAKAKKILRNGNKIFESEVDRNKGEDEMKKILVFIGSLVLTLLIMSVPILCALSFALNWAEEVKFLLTVLTIVFGAILFAIIYGEADE